MSAEPKKAGWTSAAPRLCRELLAQPLPASAPSRSDSSFSASAHEQRLRVAVHRNDAGRQPLRDRGDHAVAGRRPRRSVLLTKKSVGTRRRSSARQQERRLCLHALDRRDDEHGAVEHSEDALDLGDEVRVPGRVDEVDGDVADRERRYRRLDRDAALLLERERVGLRGAVVDAAELVDHAGGMQQPLGERCLTGVYMRQDSQVERTSKQAAYLPIRSKGPSRWVCSCAHGWLLGRWRSWPQVKHKGRRQTGRGLAAYDLMQSGRRCSAGPRRYAALVAAVAAVVLALPASSLAVPTPPPGFIDTLVASGLEQGDSDGVRTRAAASSSRQQGGAFA